MGARSASARWAMMATPMPRVIALVRAAHAVPAASVTALVATVTVARGAGPGNAVLAVASTLAGQLSVGWSNDYLDRAEDAAAGRRDKPLVAGELFPRTVWIASLVAAGSCLALAAPLGLPETAVMAGAVASAWLYNAGLKRTAASWVPYAVSFGLAPVFVWLVAGDPPPPAWVVAGASMLGVAGHLTNVLPDLERDAAARARGVPHRLGPGLSLLLACLLLGATLAVVLAAGWPPEPAEAGAGGAAAALIAGVGWAGLRGRRRLAFLVTIAAAAAVVAVFLLASVA